MFTTTIDLANLNSGQGFVIQGVVCSTINSAGDINGDGYDDVIIGAPGVDPNGRTGAGTGYVIFGKASSPSIINLNSLTSSQGFSIQGATSGDRLGYGSTTNSAGDINGDGYADMIISAPLANSNSGKIYVIFGKSQEFSAIDLADFNNNQGFVIQGVQGHYTGHSFNSAGDINGDGYSDIVIGAPDAGGAYVIFGKPYGLSNINLASLSNSEGFVVATGLAHLGISVSTANVNNDEYDDIIISADLASPNGRNTAGSVYVIFGKAEGFSTIDLDNLNNNDGFIIQGAASGDEIGWFINAAGDINGDSYDDIIIGAQHTSPNGRTNAGSSYVIFGKANGFNTIDLANGLSSLEGFIVQGARAGDNSGYSVSGAGDINGDGYDDIIIGAQHASPNGRTNAGKTYVIFGKANGFNTIDLANGLSSLEGFTVQGSASGDLIGYPVSKIGDINGDGYCDVIIGAFGVSANNSSEVGGSYVIFGGPTVITGTSDNDVFIAWSRIEKFLSNGGIDTVSYIDSTTGVTVSLVTGTGSGGYAEKDIYAGITNIIGSAYDDNITGDNGDNTIEGRGGEDYIDGGMGNNTASYANSPTAVKVNLNTGINTGGDAEGDVLLNIRNLIGSELNDVLSGNAFDNYLKGGAGDDVLISIGGGTDILEGQAGNDRFVISRAPGHITILDFTSTKDKLDLRDFNELKNFNDIILASISEGTDTTISLPGAVKVILKDITDLKYSTVNDDYILNGDDSSPPKWIDTTVGKVITSIGSIAGAYILSQLGCAWKHYGNKEIVYNHNFQWFCGGYKWLACINSAAYSPLKVVPSVAILLTPNEAKAEIKVINIDSNIDYYQFSDYQLDSYSNTTIEINLLCNNSDIDV